MDRLTIGQLAKQGQVNLESIRYYERHGLLPKAPRSPSGYRMFTRDAVRRIHFIKRAQGLGFSLKEVEELLSLQVKPGVSCADVRRKAEGKIADINQRLRALRAMKKALMQLTDDCAGRGPVSACSILESLQQESS